MNPSAIPTFITNMIGAQSMIGPAPTTFEKALEGRINRNGKGIFGKAEKEVASRVEPKKNGKTYLKERALTNPLSAAAITAVGVTPIVAIRSYGYPVAIEKLRQIQLTRQPENIALMNSWPVLKALLPEGHILTEPIPQAMVAAAKEYKNPKSMLKGLALASALIGGGVFYSRRKHAKDFLRQEQDASKSYIRTKLRESFDKTGGVNPALIDDGAIYLAKAIQLIKDEESKKFKDKPVNVVKEEIKAIEKQASLRSMIRNLYKHVPSDVQTAFYSATHHPRTVKMIENVLQSKPVRYANEVNEVGKTFYPTASKFVKSPAWQAAQHGQMLIGIPPGVPDPVTAGYGLAALHTKWMIDHPKYERFITSLINAFPK